MSTRLKDESLVYFLQLGRDVVIVMRGVDLYAEALMLCSISLVQ